MDAKRFFLILHSEQVKTGDHQLSYRAFIIALILFFILPGVTGFNAFLVTDSHAEEPEQISQTVKELTISSTAFEDGKMIPKVYTCDGEDRSPNIKWNEPPPGTKSFALICEDPDAPAGTWIHWVIFNIPDTTRELAAGFPDAAEFPGEIRQGRNDFGRIGYGGPCPPSGKPHRYFFRIFALDQMLNLPPGSDRKELDQAMENHILSNGHLMGKYKR